MLPPFDDCIPTGDTISASYRYYQFRVPADDWLIKATLGQFLNLVFPEAFCQIGAITVDDAAEVLTRVYESVHEVFPIGSLIPFAGGLPSTPDILPCDGASYLRGDYPDLFLTIGVTWGSVDALHFNVPDLRGRTLINAGTGSGLTPRTLGQSLGEETHTLITSEMPSHSHSINDFLLTGTAVPPPLDASDAIPHILNGTGTTGGDGAHNNMQPTTVINYGIVAL
jgi:microcystin-dependent protein